MSFRTIKQSFFYSFARVGIINLLQNIGHEPWSLYILTYHRVGEPGDEVEGLDLFSATPEMFEKQMQLIAREYYPVNVADVLDAVEKQSPLPRDSVLVTIDDGYRDFQEYIFPIARKYDIYPVLFVPTMFVGQGEFWWDRLVRALHYSKYDLINSPVGSLGLRTSQERRSAFTKLGNFVRQNEFETARDQIEQLCVEIAPNLSDQRDVTLNWDELRSLDRQGATIASHTHSHPIISHVSLDQARFELITSQEIIRREIGHALPIFAFPDGRPFAINDDVVDLLRSEGFKLAFTRTEGRANLRRDDPLLLPRLGVARVFSLPQFHFHLTPPYQSWINNTK